MISIIIPTLNEEKYIEKSINSVREQNEECEIIIVDGGSSDKTTEIAKNYGKVLISKKKGRAFQMNLGASEAKGDILLFLHADTTLPKEAFEEIERILKNRKVAAGSFTLYFDEEKTIANRKLFYSFLYNKPFGALWGDHAIFIRKELFNEIGRFPEIEIMEDYAFSKEARKHGHLVISKKKGKNFLSQIK